MLQVATRSSTKGTRERRTKLRRRGKIRAAPESVPESSDDSVRTEETVDVEPLRPVVQPEKGVVETDKIPDPQCRDPEEIVESDSAPRKEVRFKENPGVILPNRSIRVDEYDILHDIKD